MWVYRTLFGKVKGKIPRSNYYLVSRAHIEKSEGIYRNLSGGQGRLHMAFIWSVGYFPEYNIHLLLTPQILSFPKRKRRNLRRRNSFNIPFKIGVTSHLLLTPQILSFPKNKELFSLILKKFRKYFSALFLASPIRRNTSYKPLNFFPLYSIINRLGGI